MKKVKHKTVSKKKVTKRKSLSVVIDKKLDSLSNTIIFKRKLDKANRILSHAGIPA
jgi:hypothetical protein